MRLLAICRLWPQPCTKIAPPPCELLVIPRPSMLDGLHWKLLGNGLLAALLPQLEAVNSVVWVGKPPSRVGTYWLAPWKFTPFASTVMAAPPRAPMGEGSCRSSAKFPFRLASQPTVASNGSRSTCPT